MKSLIVDRFEGNYTICEDQEQKLFAIETAELPEAATPGTVICIDGEGVISVDPKETQNRKQRILEKQARLMRG